MKGDGYLHVADFVKVVHYNKDDYPKGIKTYEVKKGDDEEVESEPKKKSPAEE